MLINSISSQGITLIVQSTSATQVHSLFVSYIAYDPTILNLVAGNYVYDKYNPLTYLQFQPPIGVSNNNLAFHGLNSFVVKNGFASFDLTASFLNGQLSLSSSNSIYYLSYSYFFLIGGPCGQCKGYSINYNGQCMSSCPPNSYYNGITCITCQPGYIWDGKQCVNRCASEQIWNSITQVCECPQGQNWNGTNCITCKNGQIWIAASKSCACAANANWNGFVCITCNSGQIWDAQSYSCVCPSGTFWNGFTCITMTFSCGG